MHVVLKRSYLRTISQVFVVTLKSFLQRILAKSKSILAGVLYQPFEKPDFIELVNNYLKERNMSNI